MHIDSINNNRLPTILSRFDDSIFNYNHLVAQANTSHAVLYMPFRQVYCATAFNVVPRPIIVHYEFTYIEIYQSISIGEYYEP